VGLATWRVSLCRLFFRKFARDHRDHCAVHRIDHEQVVVKLDEIVLLEHRLLIDEWRWHRVELELDGDLRSDLDLEIVRRLEHTSFTTGIDAAFERVAAIERLSYQDVLETRRILFEAIYPWAGQDRLQTAPDLAVSKGSVLFARPMDYNAQ